NASPSASRVDAGHSPSAFHGGTAANRGDSRDAQTHTLAYRSDCPSRTASVRHDDRDDKRVRYSEPWHNKRKNDFGRREQLLKKTNKISQQRPTTGKPPAQLNQGDYTRRFLGGRQPLCG